LDKKNEDLFLCSYQLGIVAMPGKQGFFYVGRGSGANSSGLPNVHITDVDPIELDLYFERLLIFYRVNPPDFDIDFLGRTARAIHPIYF